MAGLLDAGQGDQACSGMLRTLSWFPGWVNMRVACGLTAAHPTHSRVLLGVKEPSCLPSDTQGTLPNYHAVQFAESAENFPFPPRRPSPFFSLCMGICSWKSREARKGGVKQPLAGSSELLNLLKCPNKCVSSWKEEPMLCFCHPVHVLSPFFQIIFVRRLK